MVFLCGFSTTCFSMTILSSGKHAKSLTAFLYHKIPHLLKFILVKYKVLQTESHTNVVPDCRWSVKNHWGCSVFNFTFRTLMPNEHVCKMWCISASWRKPFSLPPVNVMNKNLILTAVHLNEVYGPHLMANRNNSQRCGACCHAKWSMNWPTVWVRYAKDLSCIDMKYWLDLFHFTEPWHSFSIPCVCACLFYIPGTIPNLTRKC